ncbi:uncharacterized membrane protein YgaE (UPF0421/DUF939 family) [Microlunatus panaciterrae]|uniref:Uncharacterized membrane protein YgaE (UPF0421/DUF939 family) n=1 Tax=Microlunatus panaciterrae TaxID=400768 RepID=A0ABS2RG02_9ACTN|nr:FUSC family protein [Microlunatus panaciterrae]MBM7797457.1 uncharacterized membrane protein YgaE (UPF0421/DUF939 family) [Microlunatus panaciterrae]
MKLRAFDLTERTARAGRDTAHRRVQRWRSRIFMITQCAVTAGLAWWLAQTVIGHRLPFFAPVAAIICLGFTFGQRLRRGIEVAIGVAVGVFIGDVFVTYFGTGVWQIIVVCLLAMSIASLVGAGNLTIIQAGVQSIIIITLVPDPNQAFGRWLDAVIGCALAMLVATIAPSAPVRRPRLLAAGFLLEMAATLRAVDQALREGDRDAGDAVLEQARRGQDQIVELDEAVSEGLAVVRFSPFRRGQLPAVQGYADLLAPLDRGNRNLRVLARRCAIALWRGETVPLAYLVLLTSVAEVVDFMAGELYERRLPVAARDRLTALGRESSRLKLAESLSAIVILAQVRSLLCDLLELTGLTYAEAREAIPEMD